MTGGSIDLRDAERVADRVLEHAREIGCAPMTVAVLDSGGHLVVLKREDRSGILRPQIAIAKAWGSLGMRLPSKDLGRRAEFIPHFVDSLAAVSGGRVVPIDGGVLIRHDDEVIGAVGTSGDTSERDEESAVHGVLAAGLAPDADSTEPW